MKALFPWLAFVVLASAEATIVPHPAVECEPGRTIVWTAATQMVFDRVIGPKSKLGIERVAPPNPLVDRMRAFKWKEEDVLPGDGWFAVVGESTDGLAKDATEKWRKLAGKDEPPFGITGDPQAGARGIAGFAGILRNFEFPTAFIPSKDGRMTWSTGGNPVKYFGSSGYKSGDYGSQVRVLSFRPSKRSCALQLLAKQGDDTMILYIPEESQPMLEAIAWTRAWKAHWPEQEDSAGAWDDKRLHESDDLRIPEIELKRDADLRDSFAGLYAVKAPGTPWFVSQAKSMVSLRVDATGVKFKASASMQMVPLAAAEKQQPVPRRFWFDRPFYLFLWREKAEWPYAAVWFGNAEGLVK